ncbi:MAG TPA: aldose epimerase [Coxiellaceae bacterium]|nr:MAG: aldose epimerase [Gammaproteobacteria bacterium RIFCSPHIGHO2_12_FULL_36_30]HLB56261.1 aldose epimerase [Coxiellaceae bacterium]
MKKYIIVSEDGKTKATIVPDRGSFVSSLMLPFKSGAHETVFLHDYAWDNEINDLPGGIPFLFPVCARIARDGKTGIYLYDGKQYQLKIHGFSWFSKWAVNNVTENSIETILTDNADTLACFPFHFEVKLKFTALNGKFECHQTYKNTGKEKSMPYYAGFHPYFLTPEAGKGKEKVILNFQPVKRLKYNETLTDIIGEQPVFKTPVELGDSSINEQLLMYDKNRLATLTFPNGDVLKTNAFGIQDPAIFSYSQLYTIPEKPFFCVERWMSFANALNTVSGVRWLKPGESEEAVFQISV